MAVAVGQQMASFSIERLYDSIENDGICWPTANATQLMKRVFTYNRNLIRKYLPIITNLLLRWKLCKGRYFIMSDLIT